MHSCGHVYEIIEDLIEVGISVLQFDQPELHGIDNLARDFGGRDHLLVPGGHPATLQTARRCHDRGRRPRVMAKLGGYGGGFIAGYYGDNAGIGLDPHWQDVACRAFVRYGSAKGA